MSWQTMTSRSLCCRCHRAPARISTKQSATRQRTMIATHLRTGPSPASDQSPSETKNAARPRNSSAVTDGERYSSFKGLEKARADVGNEQRAAGSEEKMDANTLIG